MTPRERLVQVARSYVGTHEVGPNAGPQVEEFQRYVDGKAQGEPWCMAFVQFCVGKVADEFGLVPALFRSEHCLTVYRRTPTTALRKDPAPGFVAVWKHGPGPAGHTGICSTGRIAPSNRWTSIEGNTNLAGSREGDGVYESSDKGRTKRGELALVGFIDPFNS